LLIVPIEWSGDAGEYVGGSGGRLAGEVMAGSAMALIDPLAIGGVAKGMIGKGGKPKPTPNISRAEQMLAEVDRPPAPVNETPKFTPPTNEARPIVVDRNGVATDGMPDQGAQLGKARAEELQVQAKNDKFLQAEQGDLFEPYTNSHREFDQLGNERKPLDFEQYKATVDNLAKEPSTAFKAPEDLEAGFKQYQESLNEKQGGLFDPPTKANEFQEALYQDTVPARVQEHPFVQKADERVAKAEALVEKVSKDVEAGKVVPTILMRVERDLATLKAKQAEVASNVESALRKKEEVPAMRGFKNSAVGKKQKAVRS